MRYTINMKRAQLLAVALAGLILCANRNAVAGPDKKEKEPDFPKFEEVTKDMEVKKGFLTLYFDEKEDTLLGQIPTSMLKEPFLLSISIPKGPTYAGWMVGGSAVYWERMDKKLVLMQADTRYKKAKGSTVEDVVGRTYTDTIVKAFDIKTESPGGDPIIDFAALLKTDFVGLGEAYGGRHIDKSLSRWCTSKVFPHNVELAVDTAFMGNGPGADGILASVHLSLSKLPANGYTPREADDRIGYFLTAQKDWGADHDDKTIFKRYVHRWNVEKQDPKAAESPVKKPIVFYIEKTVPVKYRRYVREGILEWNAAFEKCGLLNAVQVRQQTDTNEFKDLDPEDIRYNFFRWIVSGRAFARGPSRVNPFTGQILDADIIFDDSMVRFYVNEYELLGADAFDAFTDPVAEDLFAAYPEYKFDSATDNRAPRFAQGRHMFDEASISEPLRALGLHEDSRCELGIGMVHQMAFNQLVSAQTDGRELPPKFIGQVIREIVAHEIGHTLGLRHNFKGSAWRKLSDIVSASSETRALTGSIMDYNPAEYAGAEIEQGDFVSQAIGPYDMWAIEYGYRPFMAGGDHDSEASMLKAITGRVAEAGLDYGTDEDTSDFGPDPYSFRYDNGDDPVAYAKHRMALSRRLMKTLADRAVADGESYARMRRAFRIVTNEYAFASRIAARMVGGQVINRDHKGDPDARSPFTLVSVEKQREALAFLGETVFSDEYFRFDPELLNKLGAGRFMHWDSDQMDFNIDYNVHDRVLGIQARVLTLLVNPLILNRVHDAELKVPESEDMLTVPELLETLTATIWSELASEVRGRTTNRQPRITSVRRNLQREYLRRLTSIQLDAPGRGLNADAHAIVRMTLKDLSKSIGATLEGSRDTLDTYTLAHLDEARHRIEKVLAAEFTDGASRSRGSRGRATHGIEPGALR